MKKKYILNGNCNNIKFIIQVPILNSKGNKDTKPIVHIPALIEFLECNGFRKLALKESYIIIQLVYGCIIVQVGEYVLKDVVFQYLQDNQKVNYKTLFYEKDFFKRSFITSLQTVESSLHSGDKESAYLYYNNGVLRITKDTTELIDYPDFKKSLWQEQILNRDINLPLSTNIEDFCFNKFLHNISGNVSDRYFSIISIIGYLLHNFKDRRLTKAIIFTDENIDVTGNSANGGSGKSILATALSRMVSICKKEGKNVELGNKFFLQDLEPYNNIIYFDDVTQNFNFESLYSIITGDATSEKKFKAPINIPFEQTPKVLISSNYIVEGREGFTDERRRVDFEFSNYYNKHVTPSSEFGHTFFSEWNQEEWHKFDSLMITCIQFYLRYGIIEVPKLKLEVNKIIQSTHPFFFEFAETNLSQGNLYNKKDLFDKFISENQEEIRITSITFKKWLDIYLLYYKKWKHEHFKSNGNAMIRIL